MQAGCLQIEQERWHTERKCSQLRKRGNSFFPTNLWPLFSSHLCLWSQIQCGGAASSVPEEAAWRPCGQGDTPLCFSNPSVGNGPLSPESVLEVRVPELAGEPSWLRSLRVFCGTSACIQVTKTLISFACKCNWEHFHLFGNFRYSQWEDREMPCVKAYVSHLGFAYQWSPLCSIFSPKFCSSCHVGKFKPLKCCAVCSLLVCT